MIKLLGEKTTWKEYEWLITKIFHDSGLATNLYFHNKKIRGLISGTFRQVDCLVCAQHNNGIKTIIECRKKKRPVGIMEVESFIAKLEDLGSPFGIIVSSSGFTDGAEKRAQSYNNIKLETIDWQRAFNQAKTNIIPDYAAKICPNCMSRHDSGKSVPGLIIWEGPYPKITDVISKYWIGYCLKCKINLLYCDSCGETTMLTSDDAICNGCSKEYPPIRF